MAEPEEDPEEMEPEHEHVPVVGLFRQPSAEEIERHNMAVSAAQHEVYGIFAGLDKDQLHGLQTLLHTINCSASEPSAAGEYFEGLTKGLLYGKHNLCPACGIDHDKETADLLTGGVPDAGNDSV